MQLPVLREQVAFFCREVGPFLFSIVISSKAREVPGAFARACGRVTCQRLSIAVIPSGFLALRTSDLEVGGSNPSGRALLPYLDRAKRHRAEPSLGGAERREDLISYLGRSAAWIGERVVKLAEGPSVLTIEWLDPR